MKTQVRTRITVEHEGDYRTKDAVVTTVWIDQREEQNA